MKNKSPRIVAVAGNMGSGKSSLVEWLRQQFDMVPFFEPNEENPYLSDFYADMSRWALNSQLFFLVRRFQIHRAVGRRAAEDPRPVVQDRTLYEDAEVFAAHLHQAGYLDERDWGMYQDLYRTLRDEIRPPDLMIYLRCPLPALTRRIRRRGRAFEKGIPRSYLASLERLYEAWYARYDLSPSLVIETDRLDYVERLFDRLEVIQAIRERLA
jgi:deoxyadenosine/deoxycytidine kinase